MRNTLVLFACFFLVACGSDRTRPGNHGGSNADGSLSGDGGIASGDGCSDQAKLVYVVDENNTFSSFKPDTLTLTDIGTLKCPAQFGATPFSMSVDRTATAWVLYNSGEVFKVNTQTLACSKTSFAQSNGFVNFGMGFVANMAGATDDTLFVAGGQPMTGLGTANATLATLDVSSLNVTTIGQINGWPELTGTGDAKLWGFFPDATNPRVSQLDKTSGQEGKSYPLASLSGQPMAWAFAFWGGDFWIFLQRSSDSNTHVYHLKSSDGSVSDVIDATGRTIVGAGVSTCAPITIG